MTTTRRSKWNPHGIAPLPPTPLVLIDTNVLVWTCYYVFKSWGTSGLSPLARERSIRALFTVYANRGPTALRPGQPLRLVFCLDKPRRCAFPYYRSREVARDREVTAAWNAYDESKGRRGRLHEPPTALDLTEGSSTCYRTQRDTSRLYKGNRPPKPDDWREFYDTCYQVLMDHFPDSKFGIRGYEADDIAAAAIREVRKSPADSLLRQRQKFLSTSDRDWSGLVDDSQNILWANSRVPAEKEVNQNRIAMEIDVLEHTQQKLKRDISHPRELYAAKAEVGEKSDNLPPGCPVRHLDLIDPYPHRDPAKTSHYGEFLAMIHSDQPNQRRINYANAHAFLRAIGVKLDERQFPEEIEP